jgi:hypothetical protein
MTNPLFANNATATLAAAYSASATALTLTAGQGSLFPSPSGGDWFAATIVNSSNVIEIVQCIGRNADTLTVNRGQEGTAARNLASGEKIDLRLTAAVMTALRDRQITTAMIPAGAITGAQLAAGSVTSATIADGSIVGADVAPGSLDASRLAAGVAQANLGFTPVQQGGGASQGANKVFLGWGSQNRLRAQVDATDLGNILTEQNNGDVSSAGYRGMPYVVENANYVFGIADIGRVFIQSDGAAHTYYIPTNGSAGIAPGTIIKINNMYGSVSIIPVSGVSLVWLPSGTVGGRTLAAPGSCVIECIWGDTWWVYGLGLS